MALPSHSRSAPSTSPGPVACGEGELPAELPVDGAGEAQPGHRLVRVLHEAQPGERWQSYFREFQPAYERWFLAEGERRRPTYLTSRRMIRKHMPELVPVYDQLVELAGGGDRAARLLGLYCPTPYVSGCSQAVWTGREPLLVRNYDYAPRLWEATIWHTRWLGRRVMCSSDCLWGALDGINEAGLAVALSFGGRRPLGEGFGIPLILRYILQVCDDTPHAMAVLQRLPVNMCYNVTVVDRDGRYLTAWLSPDREPIIRSWPICTNHQETNDWPEYVARAGSVEREKYLAARLGDPRETADSLVGAFLQPPLFQSNYRGSYGTLYTAVYRPWSKSATYLWPTQSIHQGLDTPHEEERWISYTQLPQTDWEV